MMCNYFFCVSVHVFDPKDCSDNRCLQTRYFSEIINKSFFEFFNNFPNNWKKQRKLQKSFNWYRELTFLYFMDTRSFVIFFEANKKNVTGKLLTNFVTYNHQKIQFWQNWVLRRILNKLIQKTYFIGSTIVSTISTILGYILGYYNMIQSET